MEFHDVLFSTVTTLGFIVLSKHALRFIKWVYVMFLRKPKILTDYGKWALVTGATDGIGKALAFELASKGLNVVLISRNPSKLHATSNEIREKHGAKVEVRSIAIDFTRFSGEEIVGAIAKGIKGLDVGVLINNVGVAYDHGRYFHEVEKEWIDSYIKVNVEAAIWVTWSVIPSMLEKKKGAIVNIGSNSSCTCSFPLFAIYASTKAFMSMFSKSVSMEYHKHDIDIQCQVPLFINTRMTMFESNNYFLFPSAETYSRASVRWIGYDHLCCPFWPHSIQWFLYSLLPDAVVSWFIFQFFLRWRVKT